MNEPRRRIPYALHRDGWEADPAQVATLRAIANEVTIDQYSPEMEGSIFCPLCGTNLKRVPKSKAIFSNEREPFFSHQPKWRHVRCDLRSKRPEGKHYETWEEARRAVENEELVVINGFMQGEPALSAAAPGEYQETIVEDEEGPESSVPIGRHVGENFTVPSVVTSVMGICSRFDTHLWKYYHLPGADNARLLADLLRDVKQVDDTEAVPRLYFGVVRSVSVAGQGGPNNVCMTRLECHEDVRDFTLKVLNSTAQRRGLTAKSVGRVVLVYGEVTRSGIGLAVEHPSWGEWALLPDKYKPLLGFSPA
ncbi:hypothetical protein SAMN05216421_1071 [Halopseudomonas xinjiangensis]|uniref:Uncharacterized protein n=1 Tax=Halopseudomonas xinjiangensis TaxID=487184 RepID=A0A1H1Q6P8_9GAMM|nr:hypothetical protein [Halopseudomonas xinjiangensis]SDS19172.1 hypothetical protein SAMN05216421_1071 [Halopseudomonas xinjiangensis]